jgi:hypothetical protein
MKKVLAPKNIFLPHEKAESADFLVLGNREKQSQSSGRCGSPEST